jgi:outer membrane protein
VPALKEVFVKTHFVERAIAVLAVSLWGVAAAQTTPPAAPPTTPPAAPVTQPATLTSPICFVNAQLVLEAHPDGAKVLEARKAAQTELQGLAGQIQALQQKIASGSATAADRQQYETLVRTYQTRTKTLQDQQNRLLEPITKAVDAAVTKIAPTRGCLIVLDRSIAASSGLVVYAAPGTDITNDVIAELQKR